MQSQQDAIERQVDLTTYYRLLSDPLRYRILKKLRNDNNISVGELTDALSDSEEISRSTVSHALSALEESGLVWHKEEGRIHAYSANKELLRRIFVQSTHVLIGESA